MPNTKDITPTEYAKVKGMTVANISKHIRRGNLGMLPGVIMIKDFGRFYLLEVAIDFLAPTFKEIQFIPNKKRGRKMGFKKPIIESVKFVRAEW